MYISVNEGDTEGKCVREYGPSIRHEYSKVQTAGFWDGPRLVHW